jgi:hypothetical protein
LLIVSCVVGAVLDVVAVVFGVGVVLVLVVVAVVFDFLVGRGVIVVFVVVVVVLFGLVGFLVEDKDEDAAVAGLADVVGVLMTVGDLVEGVDEGVLVVVDFVVGVLGMTLEGVMAPSLLGFTMRREPKTRSRAHCVFLRASCVTHKSHSTTPA